MTVALVYDPALEAYEFPPGHPMKPARFRLAVALMRNWGMIEDGCAPSGTPCALEIAPIPATDDELLTVHTSALLGAVKAASEVPPIVSPGFGLGGDTPAFPRMHEAAALVTGATLTATRAVLGGSVTRAFAPAGGMHHAHADRVAGFCVYNDPAVAIEIATRENPGLRVAYVDIDAHHGDGVEEIFIDRSDVLTVSVHESGAYLYPGTGDVTDIGELAGIGYALNFPLAPSAGPDSWEVALTEVVGPALRAFRPDLVFLQAGGDTHAADPLTHLENTVEGFSATVRGIVALADELCGGRIVVAGGGGYEPYSAVPRQWASAMAALLGVDVPAELPQEWRDAVRKEAGPDIELRAETLAEPHAAGRDGGASLDAARAVAESLRTTHPLLKDG